MENKVIYDLYRLIPNSDENVVLTIVIGHGQLGTSKVFIDRKEIKDESSSFSITLGSNKDLDKKELRTESYIKDIQPMIDQVSATIILTGGYSEKAWPLHCKSDDNKTYILTSTIGMTK